MKTNIVFDILPNHFENIIVGALEGGSNYWYDLKTLDTTKLTETPKGEPLAMRIAIQLYKDKTYGLPVYDRDEPKTLLGTVTQASMLEAFQLVAEKQPRHFADFISENDDATTYDVFFQFATMKDLVYG